MIRLMLVGLDGSIRTTTVFRAAMDLALQLGARTILFRAVDVPPEFPPAAATRRRDELAPKLLADARADLDDLAGIARRLGVDTQSHVVRSSEAWRAIVDAADSLEVDAIVVGSHGFGLIDRVLGTNAARVADRAHCLVVVVHAAPEADPEQSGPHRTS